MYGSTMRSRKKSKDTLKQTKMKTQQSKICGHRKNDPKREIQSITGISQVTRKSSNKQPTYILKETWERTTNIHKYLAGILGVGMELY